MSARRLYPNASAAWAALSGLSILAVTHVASADPPAPSRTGDRAASAHETGQALPQECEQDPFHVEYGALRAGSLVRLGRHRSVDGNANWDPSMEHFVGRVTPIVSARGLDPQGCPIVEVAIDAGEYVWRVRDLVMVADASASEHTRIPELAIGPGFVPDPRVYEGRVAQLTRRASVLKDGCAGWIPAHPTFTLLLEDDFPTFALMAHANIDTVLVVRTPAGEHVCVDDVEGHDPVLSGRAVAGRYEVYVGAFEPSASEPRFRIALSERSTVRVASLDSIPTADVLPLDGTSATSSGTHLQAGRPSSASPRSPERAPDDSDTRPSSNTR